MLLEEEEEEEAAVDLAASWSIDVIRARLAGSQNPVRKLDYSESDKQSFAEFQMRIR
jgi:hypothetical protein